ncbi:LysR family transcriptional regulator [Vogesella sp. LIG4]|uniref:LysR family transcriptional regulator n=1 Tax=Vogesella sp. LIG4 TaxID=1192162 RepID=UPI00081FA20A|nr:LysR family transcriptional regulator [Vogesella sp. LIG4]SCK22408.1 DNA-binding transcriptional regulator, LysR family [Vogesella sp. LIG4]
MAHSSNATRLGSIELFCKAAELGSFTAAAEAMGLTPAAVSRSIRRMEERLGVRLFARTTRSVRLTSEGELYWQECRQALGQIAEAERALGGRQQVPSGVLRISAGTLYANYRLLPLLGEFTAAYPQVALELSLSNRVVDIVDEGYDLAIRIGTPQDSRLVAHKLEDASLGVFATPAYLARRGTPQTLADLAAHDCLQFVVPGSGRGMPWLFRDADGRELELLPDSPHRVRDDPHGCISWGMAGGGLFQSYHFIAAPALARGELVEVLPAYAGRSRQFSVIYPQQRHLSARVRAFVDFMLARLRTPPR